MNKEIKYKITGLVYGNYWGGGAGAYQSEVLMGNDYKKLIKKANEMLNNGSLDSGMGYESLKGALLNIETIETIEINGKKYKNSSYDDLFIGKLSDEEKDFLRFDCNF